MKIAIITAAWKRHELLEFFCHYWAQLKTQLAPRGVELVLCCAVTDREAREICHRHGWLSTDVPNTPLYAKHNAAVQLAKPLRPQYCLCLGSDDIMNAALVLDYVERMREGTDYIAPLDWSFYDTQTRACMHWRGYRESYRHGEPCGAGRALSARLLDLLKWQPWIAGFDTVLDTGFTRNLAPHAHTRDFFHIGCDTRVGLDIKTLANMTPFKPWPNTFMIKQESLAWLSERFDQRTAVAMMALSPGEAIETPKKQYTPPRPHRPARFTSKRYRR
jgi:hypothetical protein